MSGAIVQNTVASVSTNAQNTTHANWTRQMPHNMASGNTIATLFSYSNDNGSVPLTYSDTKGNSYTQHPDIADTSGSGDERFVWATTNVANALTTSDTITIANVDTDYLEIVAWELSGLTSTPYLDSKGSWQQGITGSSANNLSTPNLAGGAGTVLVLAMSMNTLDNASAPFYPTVGTGLTFGGNWFFDSAITGSPALATWGWGLFTAPGNFPVHFTSSAASSADNYVTYAIAFAVAAGVTPTVIAVPSWPRQTFVRDEYQQF